MAEEYHSMSKETTRQFSVTWLDAGREPQCQPNPAYPTGCDLDWSGGALIACTVELPYPAKRCGVYVIICGKCGHRVSCTTAGRLDDPRSVTLPCDSRRTVAVKRGDTWISERFRRLGAQE